MAELTSEISSTEEPIAISLVIPAYNEAGRIADTLATSVDALDALGVAWELLLVDDGSTDRTAAIAEAFAHEHQRVRVVRLPHRGKASSVAHGLSVGQGEVVVFSDADLATPPPESAPAPTGTLARPVSRCSASSCMNRGTTRSSTCSLRRPAKSFPAIRSTAPPISVR